MVFLINPNKEMPKLSNLLFILVIFFVFCCKYKNIFL